METPPDSNAAPRNPWNRNPPPAAAANASSAAAAAPVVAVLAEEPWPPLTAPQIAAEEAAAAAAPPPPAVVSPAPPPPPPPNRHPNSSNNRRGGRNNHYNQNHHRRNNQGFFPPNHHQNRFPAPTFHPPPQHVRNPNPNLAFGPALPPMQPQQVWFSPQPPDWMVPRPPLYANGHGYMDGGFAPPHVYHPMIAAQPQFPPMGPPAAAQVPLVQGGPVAGLRNQDAQLMEDIRRQIEYYFSEENLVKDAYLKQKMDEFGWVDLGLIATFRKVVALTKDVEMIRSAMAISHVVQLEGDKVRVRHNWQRWKGEL